MEIRLWRNDSDPMVFHQSDDENKGLDPRVNRSMVSRGIVE